MAGSPTPIVHFESVGSTNVEALARAAEQAPRWFVAERQLSGRGRRGRPWASEPGNLYASLLLRDAAPAARQPELCFVASLALHDAVRHLTGIEPARIDLKWPNDVLIDGGKLAGILLESVQLGEGIGATVVGFGINCAHCPVDTPYKAVSLASAGFTVEPANMLAALDAAMQDRLQQWARGEGFFVIREAWLRRASGVGHPVIARLGERESSGIFEALDESGAMVLRRPDGGCEIVNAGDVFPMPGG